MGLSPLRHRGWFIAGREAGLDDYGQIGLVAILAVAQVDDGTGGQGDAIRGFELFLQANGIKAARAKNVVTAEMVHVAATCSQEEA